MISRFSLVPRNATISPPPKRSFSTLTRYLAPRKPKDLEAHGVTLLTPSGRWGRVLKGLELGLSVGTVDEPTLRTFGLSGLHLTDAVRVISRQALAAGAQSRLRRRPGTDRPLRRLEQSGQRAFRDDWHLQPRRKRLSFPRSITTRPGPSGKASRLTGWPRGATCSASGG